MPRYAHKDNPNVTVGTPEEMLNYYVQKFPDMAESAKAAFNQNGGEAFLKNGVNAGVWKPIEEPTIKSGSLLDSVGPDHPLYPVKNFLDATGAAALTPLAIPKLVRDAVVSDPAPGIVDKLASYATPSDGESVSGKLGSLVGMFIPGERVEKLGIGAKALMDAPEINNINRLSGIVASRGGEIPAGQVASNAAKAEAEINAIRNSRSLTRGLVNATGQGLLTAANRHAQGDPASQSLETGAIVGAANPAVNWILTRSGPALKQLGVTNTEKALRLPTNLSQKKADELVNTAIEDELKVGTNSSGRKGSDLIGLKSSAMTQGMKQASNLAQQRGVVIDSAEADKEIQKMINDANSAGKPDLAEKIGKYYHENLRPAIFNEYGEHLPYPENGTAVATPNRIEEWKALVNNDLASAYNREASVSDASIPLQNSVIMAAKRGLTRTQGARIGVDANGVPIPEEMIPNSEPHLPPLSYRDAAIKSSNLMRIGDASDAIERSKRSGSTGGRDTVGNLAKAHLAMNPTKVAPTEVAATERFFLDPYRRSSMAPAMIKAGTAIGKVNRVIPRNLTTPTVAGVLSSGHRNLFDQQQEDNLDYSNNPYRGAQ